MKYALVTLCLILCSPAASVMAEDCGMKVTYEGKGAGEVVFDGPLHSSKGFTCASCHDGLGLANPLFEMKKRGNNLSMRKMDMGRSCGYCHNGKNTFSTASMTDCSKCHHKE